MKIACFLDTNVLLYAASTRIDEPRRFEIAEQLLTKTYFGLSGQVLAEFISNLKKRISIPPTLEETSRWLDLFANYPIVPVDEKLVRAGVTVSQRYKISYWDGAIVAAADRLGAPILYTEDLNHGQTYGSVKVINPFKVH
jgi:predicted nucleic acid-binding protein